MELTDYRTNRTASYLRLNQQVSPKLPHKNVCPKHTNLPHNQTSTPLDNICSDQTAVNLLPLDQTSSTIPSGTICPNLRATTESFNNISSNQKSTSSNFELSGNNICANPTSIFLPSNNICAIQTSIVPSNNTSYIPPTIQPLNTSSPNLTAGIQPLNTSSPNLTAVIQPLTNTHSPASVLPTKQLVDRLDPLLIALFLPSRCQLISYFVLLFYTATTFALVVLFDAFHPSTETETSTSELLLFLVCQRLVIMCFFLAFF
uniref:Uncharacterized protein n=1 Tax=Cacopsylla melanoneura TaxID=428564 RepID=A0A8D9EJE2_9HEMI